MQTRISFAPLIIAEPIPVVLFYLFLRSVAVSQIPTRILLVAWFLYSPHPETVFARMIWTHAIQNPKKLDLPFLLAKA